MIAIGKVKFEPFNYEIQEDSSQKQLEAQDKIKSGQNNTNVEVNPKRGKYICEFCDQEFTRKDRLDRHQYKHTKLVSIVSFKRLQMKKLANKVISIHFQKQFKCSFEGCGKEYSCDSHLRRHIRTSHEIKPVIGTFVCKDPKCGQEFTNISNMHRHFKTQHYLHYFFPCTECDSHFRRKMKLKRHMIEAHKIGEYKYTCGKCEQGFFDRPSFSKHAATHKQKEERPCDNCEQTFLRWSDLVKHRREVHKVKQIGRFYCDLCPRMFTWKKSLREHMKIHEKNRTSFFECTYVNCPKYYTTKSNLKAHIRSKHEGKKFKCSFCNLELSTKQRYEQHLKAHISPKKEVKDSCLALLLGLQMQHIVNVKDETKLAIAPPMKIDVPTESEFSD